MTHPGLGSYFYENMDVIMKNLVLICSIIINGMLFSVLIREKGGWEYLKHKLHLEKKGTVYTNKPEYDVLYAQYKAMPRIPESIVFVGNSLTKGCDWPELFGNRSIRNRGIGGDCAKGVSERLDEILDPPPKKMFLELGLSDLARGFSVKEFLHYYSAIVDSSRKVSPAIAIYIQSIFPVREGVPAPHPFGNKEIRELNDTLKHFASEKYCTFIDLFPHFVSESGEMDSLYTTDGIHLNSRGYLVWKSQIERFVYDSSLVTRRQRN